MAEEIMKYEKLLPDGLLLRHMKAEDAEQLEALQYLVFPNLAEEELLHAPQYRRHLELFPEGQYVIADKEKIIAATTTMQYHRDENDTSHHSFFDIMGGGWLSTHNPQGDWLYGLDMGVDIAYRGKGLAKELYKARHFTCKALGLKGQMMVGMLSGFYKHSNNMGLDEYYEKVKTGELFDPTVSVQKKVGFEIKRLMKDYLNDLACGNAGAEMILKSETTIH